MLKDYRQWQRKQCQVAQFWLLLDISSVLISNQQTFDTESSNWLFFLIKLLSFVKRTWNMKLSLITCQGGCRSSVWQTAKSMNTQCERGTKKIEHLTAAKEQRLLRLTTIPKLMLPHCRHLWNQFWSSNQVSFKNMFAEHFTKPHHQCHWMQNGHEDGSHWIIAWKPFSMSTQSKGCSLLCFLLIRGRIFDNINMLFVHMSAKACAKKCVPVCCKKTMRWHHQSVFILSTNSCVSHAQTMINQMWDDNCETGSSFTLTNHFNNPI